MTKKVRTPALREALRFFDLVARTPDLQVRIAALRKAGAEPKLRVIAATYGCRCDEAALQQAFRTDWRMRQRRFAADRVTLASPVPRGGRAHRLRSRS